MIIDPKYKSPREPFLAEEGFLPPRSDVVRALNTNLRAMTKHAEGFGAAVALYEFSKANEPREGFERSLYSMCVFTAAQQGVLELYNYRMGMDAFMKLRPLCKEWSDTFDNAKLEATRDSFRASFPKTKEMRQSLMHKAELHRNPENAALNALRPDSSLWQTMVTGSGGVGQILVTGGVILNDRYSATFGGYDVGYMVTAESIEMLNENASSFFSAVRNGRDKEWLLRLSL